MEIVIIILLIFLNGFFAMSEIAIVSARKGKLINEAKKGNKSAKIALKLVENPDNFLSTVQIGITLISILTGIYSGVALADKFAVLLESVGVSIKYSHVVAQTSIIIVVTYVTIVLGELIPKRIGLNIPTKVAMLIAKPMHLLSIIAIPFVWLLSKSTSLVSRLIGLKNSEGIVTEEEIKSIIHEGTSTGMVRPIEKDIFYRVFNLGDRKISSIMTSVQDVVWIDIAMTNEEMRNLIKENSHVVYPIADKIIDNIIGTVAVVDLFDELQKDDFDIKEVITQPLFIHENKDVYEAFDYMKDNRSDYGLICDEFGGLVGVVTYWDILKGLVGELLENHDDFAIKENGDGSFLVVGQCDFYHFLQYFHVEELYSEHKFNTLSGLILDVNSDLPKVGDVILWNKFSIKILEVNSSRIHRLLIHKIEH